MIPRSRSLTSIFCTRIPDTLENLPMGYLVKAIKFHVLNMLLGCLPPNPQVWSLSCIPNFITSILFSWSSNPGNLSFSILQASFPQSKPVTKLSHLDLWKFTQVHLFLFTPDTTHSSPPQNMAEWPLWAQLFSRLLSLISAFPLHTSTAVFKHLKPDSHHPCPKPFIIKICLQSKSLEMLQGVILSLVSSIHTQPSQTFHTPRPLSTLFPPPGTDCSLLL